MLYQSAPLHMSLWTLVTTGTGSETIRDPRSLIQTSASFETDLKYHPVGLS